MRLDGAGAISERTPISAGHCFGSPAAPMPPLLFPRGILENGPPAAAVRRACCCYGKMPGDTVSPASYGRPVRRTCAVQRGGRESEPPVRYLARLSNIIIPLPRYIPVAAAAAAAAARSARARTYVLLVTSTSRIPSPHHGRTVFFFLFTTTAAAVTERELAGLLCRNRTVASFATSSVVVYRSDAYNTHRGPGMSVGPVRYNNNNNIATLARTSAVRFYHNKNVAVRESSRTYNIHAQQYRRCAFGRIKDSREKSARVARIIARARAPAYNSSADILYVSSLEFHSPPSMITVNVWLACFALAATAIGLPLWGYFESPQSEIGTSGSERGHFGPWQLCKQSYYGRTKCGDLISRFHPEETVRIAGYFAIAGTLCLAVFCLLSIIQLAMVVSKEKVVLAYSKTVITKLVFAFAATLLAIIAAGLFALQTDDKDNSYQVTRGESFYMQIGLIILNFLLFVAAIYDLIFSRRLGGDPTISHRDPSGVEATTFNNPSFKEKRRKQWRHFGDQRQRKTVPEWRWRRGQRQHHVGDDDLELERVDHNAGYPKPAAVQPEETAVGQRERGRRRRSRNSKSRVQRHVTHTVPEREHKKSPHTDPEHGRLD
ncbi:Hypothetical protein CINCED_3A007572 [Cinara cedri]|uniref:Uncharacterized protein n=1 Tax=Cinara cedri TaxID=506608 RepID=A0A5E4MER3_9HEMI|nr:Hypothetical protein CINCED_3A007572 [Cinara cedri]